MLKLNFHVLFISLEDESFSSTNEPVFLRATADLVEAVEFATQMFKATMGARQVYVKDFSDSENPQTSLSLEDNTSLSDRMKAYEEQIQAQMRSQQNKFRPLKKQN